jgi:NADH kinase
VYGCFIKRTLYFLPAYYHGHPEASCRCSFGGCPDNSPNIDAVQNPIDLIITLGGDGTILHASSLFKTSAVPPVLSFSMGTLGFLLPFSNGVFLCPILLLINTPDIDTYPQALDEVFTGSAIVLERMRIACRFHRQDGSEKEGYEGSGMSGLFCHRGCVTNFTTIGWQVMNEVTLHRGRSPHLNIIDAYVDGQHLTEAVVSGLTFKWQKTDYISRMV